MENEKNGRNIIDSSVSGLFTHMTANVAIKAPDFSKVIIISYYYVIWLFKYIVKGYL